MKLSTKENILREICNERGLKDAGAYTEQRIWEILRGINAKTRAEMKRKLIDYFNFDAC